MPTDLTSLTDGACSFSPGSRSWFFVRLSQPTRSELTNRIPGTTRETFRFLEAFFLSRARSGQVDGKNTNGG